MAIGDGRIRFQSQPRWNCCGIADARQRRLTPSGTPRFGFARPKETDQKAVKRWLIPAGSLPQKLKTMSWRVAVMMAMVIGGGEVYNQSIGDGPMPVLNPVVQTHPHLVADPHRNNTEHLGRTNNASLAEHWEALSDTLTILEALSPEIHQWVVRQYDGGRISLEMPPHTAAEDSGAAFDWTRRTLYLPELFWSIPDVEKVTYLVHEYRHARQNLPKIFNRGLLKLITGKQFSANETDWYDSSIEDEAYLYQKAAFYALGLEPDTDVLDYLGRRGLNDSHHIH